MTTAMYIIGLFKQPFFYKLFLFLFVIGIFSVLLQPVTDTKAAVTPSIFSENSPIKDPQIAQWLNVAQDYWEDDPNCPAGIWVGYWDNPQPSNGLAQAAVGGCQIWISRSWWPSSKMASSQALWQKIMCNGITHEYGHLIGYEHSENTKDVMYEAIQFNVPACNNVAKAPVAESKEENPGQIPDIDATFNVYNYSSKNPTIKIKTKNVGNDPAKKVKVCVKWGASTISLSSQKGIRKVTKNCFEYNSLAGRKSKNITLKVKKRSSSKPRLYVYVSGQRVIG